MISTGTKNDMYKKILNLLDIDFNKRKIKENYFVSKNNVFFKLSLIFDKEAIVVEYADNERDVILNRFEDGDPFYIEDYDTVEELYNNILNEIKEA